MGSLLPVFIFYWPSVVQTQAAVIVAALLIIFDRAFIVYSRLILRTILIACGFLALLMVFLRTKEIGNTALFSFSLPAYHLA